MDEEKRYYEELNQIWWALEARTSGVIAVAALLGLGLQLVIEKISGGFAGALLIGFGAALVVAAILALLSFIVIWGADFTPRMRTELTRAVVDPKAVSSILDAYTEKAKIKLGLVQWATAFAYVALVSFLLSLWCRWMKW